MYHINQSHNLKFALSVKPHILILSLLLLASCAAVPSTPTEVPPTPTTIATVAPSPTHPDSRSADFYVQYTWAKAALESIYYYEYDIRIGSAAEGEIEFRVGYEPDLVWTESFTVEEADLDALYALMFEAGVFVKEWQQMEEIPDGSHATKMKATAYGKEVFVPAYVEDEQDTADIWDVYEAIESLVPEEIWEKLRSQHKQYVEENDEEEYEE